MIASLLVAAALAAAPPPTGASEVVARVDAVVLDAAAVAQRAAAFGAQGEHLEAAQVLSTLVDEVLLAAEAERLGLRKDPAYLARIEATRRRFAAAALLDAEVASVAPPESMLREMYHASSDFARLETLAFETSEAAGAARDRIARGSSFAAEAKGAVVAQLYPTPESAPFLLRAQLAPALAAAVFAAKPGAVVGPVAAGPGFTVARVLAIEIGDEKGFAAKRESLVEHARKQLATQARAHLAQSLRAGARVQLDEAFLKGVKGLDATPEEQQHVIATVGGKPLRYGDVLPSIRTIAESGMGGHLAGPTVRTQVAWQEIDARLLQDVAVERGYDRRPEVGAQVRGAERNVLALLAAERIRAAAPSPTEAELKAFYDRNAAALRKPLQQVIPEVAAGAAQEKRERFLLARVEELRRNAVIKIDSGALARATGAAR
ncbi:peptidyl-prolyl cis-trans isomerase [Anaeromyxobacter oryzae]|uniref:PpiC domain-containing protein n=1 Tax=Anaeromyxobacter oryzae TaxID=2918170 RepID=A0ABM7X4T6_9BACT|nr:peptidyl-prolyl cis-trans isomerase [Anaeromyxobacter oryzae]BDG06840.1 hypothetical protein AMOR_58360 [Anaeromyxobacter oryzae]